MGVLLAVWFILVPYFVFVEGFTVLVVEGIDVSVGGLVVAFCCAFDVSTCGILFVVVSSVDNIPLVVYTLAKQSFSPY